MFFKQIYLCSFEFHKFCIISEQFQMWNLPSSLGNSVADYRIRDCNSLCRVQSTFWFSRQSCSIFSRVSPVSFIDIVFKIELLSRLNKRTNSNCEIINWMYELCFSFVQVVGGWSFSRIGNSWHIGMVIGDLCDEVHVEVAVDVQRMDVRGKREK